MDGIHEILDAVYLSSEEDVLTTIIHVEGSAYRKEGTSMLIRKDGTKVGLLSAGCLETDLQYRVLENRENMTSHTVVYDMRDEDDLQWGQGAGCNGVIRVLLEPIDACLRDHLSKVKYFLDNGSRVTILKKLSTEHSVSDYLFFADHNQFFGKWHGGVANSVKELITQIHNSKPKSGVTYCPKLSSEIYNHTFEPKPRLRVFGAGTDAIPLVKLASNAGFSVLVTDWRSDWCTEDNFPDADQLIVGFPSEVIPTLHLTTKDFILILTHNFQRDKEILSYLLEKDLNYIGILGSRARTERLFDGKPIPPQISSPVGMSIGAEGPEEIAISVAAELIQQRVHMSEKVFSCK
ncbi:XdhC family protein [Bacillus sp. MRMR6]|uniref:XdhC family protein n=1 Tax=Bacillus sp. MRMR6 TaxID=1928617 RepID=UPI0009532AA3|nr:XdhC family protein [Bacillus sp. MRMR6]OLS40545.1 xanthine dehydrogenase [Bacillus sp. MRMR6]